MRPNRKPNEQRVIDILKEELSRKNLAVTEDTDITDRPDALLIIDGKRVAIECRIFTPEKIMELHGFKKAPAGLNQLFLPIEPHIWIRESVNAKSPSLCAYKRRSRAEEAWLLLHAGAPFFSHVANQLAASWEVVGSVYGVYTATHRFDRVYIISESSGVAICLFRRERGYCIPDPGYLNYPGERIPIAIEFWGKVPIQQLDSGHKGIRVNLGEPIRRIPLQPLDQDYIADYSRIDELDFASIGQSQNYPTMYARRR